jgi:hypothetical protein
MVTTKRLDNVGIVADDLAAAVAVTRSHGAEQLG